MRKETKEFICYAVILIMVVMIAISQIREEREKIKILKQNNIEQIEEKEVYINRCKMYEDLMEGSGLVVDECECK